MSFRVSFKVSFGFHLLGVLIYGFFKVHAGFHVKVSYQEFLSRFI